MFPPRGGKRSQRSDSAGRLSRRRERPEKAAAAGEAPPLVGVLRHSVRAFCVLFPSPFSLFGRFGLSHRAPASSAQAPAASPLPSPGGMGVCCSCAEREAKSASPTSPPVGPQAATHLTAATAAASTTAEANTLHDEIQAIPPRPVRPPPIPTWNEEPRQPQQDPWTLSPVHLVISEEPGNFVPSDQTMQYFNHGDMVE